MKTLAVVACMLGATALADYPPPSVKCTVPPECTTCSGVYPGACGGNALDAGLLLSECFDFTGFDSYPTSKTSYYCPPGVVAYRATGCGCTSAGAVAAMFLAAVPLFRRRRVAKGKGYEAQLTETGDEQNPFQVVTSVAVKDAVPRD